MGSCAAHVRLWRRSGHTVMHCICPLLIQSRLESAVFALIEIRLTGKVRDRLIDLREQNFGTGNKNARRSSCLVKGCTSKSARAVRTGATEAGPRLADRR